MKWNIYNLETGSFTGAKFTGSRKAMLQNLPAGHGAIEGEIDLSRNRVDLESLDIIPCTPRKPDDTELETFSWDAASDSWISSPTEFAKSEAIRSERDRLLRESDWTQLQDSPLFEAQRNAWQTYRQALRDVTEQEGFPNEITWPEAPQ